MNSLSKEIPFTIPPVVKIVDYAGTPEEAFARFSEQIGVWWPLATHSVARKADGVTVAFERLEAGVRLIERWSTGETHVWGTITDFDRPYRLAFTWHVGRSEDAAQRVEVTFTASGPEQTRVRLVHSGWELLGDAAADRRDAYEQGWVPVLRLYIMHPKQTKIM
jgi:uncharacterized protein YndB with AHSA1/START domain